MQIIGVFQNDNNRIIVFKNYNFFASVDGSGAENLNFQKHKIIAEQLERIAASAENRRFKNLKIIQDKY